jgi:hypothetical protein
MKIPTTAIIKKDRCTPFLYALHLMLLQKICYYKAYRGIFVTMVGAILVKKRIEAIEL